MKRSVIAILLCVTSHCFAAITLVQSTAGGSVSASGSGVGPTTYTTSAAGFSSPTTPGNLLVCVFWGNYQSTNGVAVGALGLQFPTTSGFTWTGVRAVFGWQTGGNLNSGQFGVSYIANAPLMNPSDLTTESTVLLGNSGGNYNVQVEFTLYEFSGAATSSPVEQNIVATGSSSSPNPGTITIVNANDMIFVGHAGNRSGTNASVGAGYTLGINATVAILGQVQYQTSVTTGAHATAFSGSIPNWGAMAVAFKPAASVGVPRRRGYVF